MIAICPAGPPKEMNPNLIQNRNASAKETLRVAWRRSLSRASPASLDRATFGSLLAILSPLDFRGSRLSTSSYIFAHKNHFGGTDRIHSRLSALSGSKFAARRAGM